MKKKKENFIETGQSTLEKPEVKKQKIDIITTVESSDPIASQLAASIKDHNLDKFKAIVSSNPELLEKRNIFTIKRIVKSDTYITKVSYEHLLALYGFCEAISYIIDNKKYLDLNSVAENGLTPLMFASQQGHTEIVEKMIAGGADVKNTNQKNGVTPLMWAAMRGHTGTVEKLISLGADVNKSNEKDGWTPLMYASHQGHTETLVKLISLGADVNEVNVKDGITPLMYAAEKGHTEIVEKLIVGGADVNKANDTTGVTPLMWAAMRGHTGTVEKLISLGADENKVNYYDITPLNLAAQNGHTKTVENLIFHKADVNKANKNGFTPLMRAAENGHIEITNILIAAGADKLTNKSNISEPILKILEAQEYIIDLLEGKKPASIKDLDATLEEMLLARVENILSKSLESGKIVQNINSIKATFEAYKKDHQIADKVLAKIDEFVEYTVLDKDAEVARSFGLSFPQSLKDIMEFSSYQGDNAYEVSEKLLKAYDNHKGESSVIERLNELKDSFESYLSYKKSYLGDHPEHNLSEIPKEILPKLSLMFSDLLQLEGMDEYQSAFDEAPLLEEAILFYSLYPGYQLPGNLTDIAQ
jgi:ankyrin repeat protein